MNNSKIIISYKGLPNGFQDYCFKIGNDFFSELEYSLIEHGELLVNVKMEKRDKIFYIDINVEGKVEVQCDRCLDLFFIPINYEGKVIAGEEIEENDEDKEDRVSVNIARMEIDLTHYIYESIILSIPIQCIHPDDNKGDSTCNKEMMKLLKTYTINSK